MLLLCTGRTDHKFHCFSKFHVNVTSCELSVIYHIPYFFKLKLSGR